jgi:hypothetical protein
MDDSTEKQKLWKIYGILMGVMVGGAVLILGGQAAWNTIQQNLAKSNTPSSSATESLTSIRGRGGLYNPRLPFKTVLAIFTAHGS